jgi:hypothetical protein
MGIEDRPGQDRPTPDEREKLERVGLDEADGRDWIPDGSTLAESVAGARRDADRDQPHAAARYGRPCGEIRDLPDAVDGLDEPPPRAAPTDRGTPDRERPGRFPGGYVEAARIRGGYPLTAGDVFVVGDPRQVETVPRPRCIDCTWPVPWRHVGVTIGLDVTTEFDGTPRRAVAYAFRASEAIHPRCRRRRERRTAADTIRQVGPIVRTLVEGLTPPTVRIGRTLVEACAPLVTSPIRDGRAAGEHAWRVASERVRAWTRCAERKG